MKEADALPRRSTWMNMAPRVTTDSQGMSRREAMGWRAPLPFWALRAAKLCRVKRFLERAELSEVELVTTSSAGREGGAGGGAGQSHPGPPQALRLPWTCPGPQRLHMTCLLRAPTLLPVLRARPSTHLCPSQGAWRSGLTLAPTFALLGGPGAPGSAQHPPLPFLGGLALRARPSTHLCPSRGARRFQLNPAPTFALLRGPSAPG